MFLILLLFLVLLGSTKGQDSEICWPDNICWPDSRFTLLKPRSGCPDECGVDFLDDGFIFFNTEEQDNRNSASPDLHISGSVSDFAIRIEFCQKRFSTSNGYTWSPGCYCVFSRLCTAPFEEGMSTWYTETTVPANRWGGRLPDGTFQNHTITIKYCCRCDGDPNVPIILPREQEFYLMTHFQASNSCQLVEGMDVRPEYIQWHTDKSENNNTFTNPIPTGVSNTPNPFIVFCYYSPAPNTITTAVLPTSTPVCPVQSTVSSTTPQSTVQADSTSDNRLVQDVVIPATISVTILLCITFVIVVTIIVVGVVCCVRKKKDSYKNPDAPQLVCANPHTSFGDLVHAPDLPPDDRVYYSEVREHEDRSHVVNSVASYIVPGDRHYSLDPTEWTGVSTSVRSQRLEEEDITNLKEEPSLDKTEDYPDKKGDDVAMPTSTTEVSSFPPLESSNYQVLNDDDDEDVTLEFYPPPPTEFALYDFIGRMKRPCRIPSDDIIIGEMIGQGNFGEVHQGAWRKNGEDVNVAVKMQNDKAKEKEKVTFLQEAATMGQFNHPNIVKMFGIVPEKGRSDSCEMIVMEYLSNGTLYSYLPNVLEGLTQAQASERLLQFSREIATGMEYLSQKKFVHRDLAARNILLDSKLVCKIADFGMARDIDDSYYYKAVGGVVPLKWTAPEALAYRKYSTASDVWSYGCVLYEIWSLGEKPLESLNVVETYTKLTNGYRQFPPPGCPRSVYQLMIDCWNLKPAARPSFNAIRYTLKQPKECTLQWSRADLAVHENAAVLGADLAIGQSLYADLQGVYCSDK